MNRFDPVTVKMAKEQALPISAEGLAGQCGRLKCCLRFEYEQYREANRALPKIRARVLTADGPSRVLVGHPLRETVSVALDRRGENEFARTVEVAISAIRRRKHRARATRRRPMRRCGAPTPPTAGRCPTGAGTRVPSDARTGSCAGALGG